MKKYRITYKQEFMGEILQDSFFRIVKNKRELEKLVHGLYADPHVFHVDYELIESEPTEIIDETKEKFLVESYDGKTPKMLQDEMNRRHRDGYCPIAIEINHYQREVEGFIVYELQGAEENKVK